MQINFYAIRIEELERAAAAGGAGGHGGKRPRAPHLGRSTICAADFASNFFDDSHLGVASSCGTDGAGPAASAGGMRLGGIVEEESEDEVDGTSRSSKAARTTRGGARWLLR
jgi:hypothetical protein